ncbi:MAG TPA: hypothetical protein VM869_06825 [Enhygromyxa sp.]|nr:hypothetical protein [Enhygromyxa sp.]
MHDFSAMSEAQARTLLREHAGRVCVRYQVTASGQLLFTDTPATQRWIWVAAVASLVALLGLGCESAESWRVAPARLPPEPPADPIVMLPAPTPIVALPGFELDFDFEAGPTMGTPLFDVEDLEPTPLHKVERRRERRRSTRHQPAD